GADIAAENDSERADPHWSRIVAGPWLAETLASLRSPASLAAIEPGAELKGTLRPYQSVGVRWLQRLSSLGLGACLADDMGLGKTIQVLALLLVRRRQDKKKQPSVLVAPASLLGNWAAECARFAPSLRVLVAHPSERSASELAALTPADLAETDLVITSYGCLARFAWLRATPWKLAILDEAQAIKNPGAQQTRAVKELVARARIALTGTPIENRLGDLWSLFDFINPGLLGSAREFTSYTKRLAGRPGQPYGPLRELVRPYLLRRLKTDRSVIADLPDKTELKAFCALTKKQAALYQAAVKELRGKLEGAQGIARRGLVLAFLMRFKQLCNHPSQWLGDGAWDEADSGKWARLRELAEVVAARQEKALVFTQFRELAAPLAAFLGAVFGRPGLVLHGGTPVAQRRALVQRFQEDERVPFFVLSLKAGGSGLNLTAAAHVIHFDRWWNPAVENQATDRAFRIGQTKNVLVHKFLCKGTVEEKIDALIESKKALATELLEGGAELDLSGMGDKELLELVALDLSSALKE
ncbi:MAG: DEAD/DEAH box helicase, partial [Planctomycetota bacterium]